MSTFHLLIAESKSVMRTVSAFGPIRKQCGQPALTIPLLPNQSIWTKLPISADPRKMWTAALLLLPSVWSACPDHPPPNHGSLVASPWQPDTLAIRWVLCCFDLQCWFFGFCKVWVWNGSPCHWSCQLSWRGVVWGTWHSCWQSQWLLDDFYDNVSNV